MSRGNEPRPADALDTSQFDVALGHESSHRHMACPDELARLEVDNLLATPCTWCARTVRAERRADPAHVVGARLR